MGLYPKETYTLLKQAEIKNAVSLELIRSIAKKHYSQAEMNFSEWQRIADYDPNSEALQAKMQVNASTINGLRNSAIEKMQYAEKLKGFFKNN